MRHRFRRQCIFITLLAEKINDGLISGHLLVSIAPAPSGDSKTGLSTSSENQPDYSEEGKRNRKHNSSVYYCVWKALLWVKFGRKDVLISGHILVSPLFELFGESILSFISSPGMSLFLWPVVKVCSLGMWNKSWRIEILKSVKFS